MNGPPESQLRGSLQSLPLCLEKRPSTWPVGNEWRIASGLPTSSAPPYSTHVRQPKQNGSPAIPSFFQATSQWSNFHRRLEYQVLCVLSFARGRRRVQRRLIVLRAGRALKGSRARAALRNQESAVPKHFWDTKFVRVD